MPDGSASALSCSPTAGCAGLARSTSFVGKHSSPPAVWRRSSLRLPETPRVRHAPLWPLLAKELWEVLSGRALWTMLLLLCPLIGYSFVQAVSLYSEASV